MAWEVRDGFWRPFEKLSYFEACLTLAVIHASSDNTHRTPKSAERSSRKQSTGVPEEVAIMEKTSPHGSVVTV